MSTRLPSVAWKVLFAGLVIREAFSFWTGHPYDFEVWLRTGHAVAQGMDPYSSFWGPVPGISFAFLGTTLPSAAYLPFWPGTLGELYRVWEAVGGGDPFVLYLFLKQPPILGDLLSAGLLYVLVLRWTRDPARALGALAFWSFFPYAIVISAIWGQFDSIVVATILATFAYRKPLERNVLYGFGIFVKWITAIYLPLEVFRSRGRWRATLVIALVTAFALSALVIASEGWGFAGILLASSSQTHGGGGGMNYVGILTGPVLVSDLGSVPNLYAAISYLYVPGVIGAGWIAARWIGPGDPRSELRAVMLVTAVFLLLRWGLHEQYMVYLFALMALDIAAFHPGRRSFLRYLWLLSFVYLLFNNDFGARFLTPLDTSLWSNLINLESSSGYGTVRLWALAVLDAGITVSLFQWIREIVRDRALPVPWLWPWVARPPPFQHPSS